MTTNKCLVATLLSFFVFTGSLQAQKVNNKLRDFDSLMVYTNSFKRTITDKIYQWENTKGVDLSNEIKYPSTLIDSVVLYPIVKLSFYDCKDDSPYNVTIISDSTLEICAIAYPYLKVYGYSIKKKDLGAYASGIQILNLVNKSKVLNHHPGLFCYFLDSEKYQTSILAKRNAEAGLLFFYAPFSGPVSCDSLLKYRYGSFEKYTDLVNEEIERINFKKEAFANFNLKRDAKNFVKNSWQYRIKYLPNDTVNNIKYLLQDINLAVGPTNGQLRILRKEIEHRVKLGSPEKYFGPGSIIFMQTDITYLLDKVLTPQELMKYKKHLKISNYLYTQVDTYLFTYEKPKMINKDRIPLEEDLNNYKKFILDIINNYKPLDMKEL
ncbi:MAG: hypothetical protein WBP45_12350 [Daejeonella sp.]